MFDLLLDTSDFPARWQCGVWSSTHGWTHIISDIAIFGAYAAIPVALVFFASRRDDFPFLPIFWLFGAFILLCGAGHLVEATIFWNPWYRLSAVVKAVTAIASWATFFALVPVIPKALSLPGIAAANARMEQEIADREATERELRESYADLQMQARNMIDQEDRVIELKNEINRMLVESGREPRYATHEG